MRKYRVPCPPAPTKDYNLKIMPAGIEIKVEVAGVPFSRHGLPGSILDIVSTYDEGLIEHTCGGVQACSTCHVYISKGADSCNESSEREEDYLEKAPAIKLSSRLACCVVPDGSEDITVEIPGWNKNEVKES